MNRVAHRCFLSLLSLAFVVSLAVSSIPSNSGYSQNNRPVITEIRGVWLTNVASGLFFVPWGVERALNQLATLNFNTIYPVVWNRGYTFYNSALAKKVTGSATLPLLRLIHGKMDFLVKLVKLSQAKGLNVIPWFEYGLMTPRNSALAYLHPDWLTTARGGINSDVGEGGIPHEEINNGVSNRIVWLNPLHPEVQKFIKGLIVEVVINYDVNGIQLDDHFGMPVQFGYDPFTLQLYQKEHQGKNPPIDAFDVEWMRWRADKITNFMAQIYQAVKKVKPNATISLSPNSQEFSYKYYLQDWANWVKKGLVDGLILQVYRDDRKSFIGELDKPELKFARSKIPVGVGILTGTLTHPVDINQIREQVQIVRDRNFSGVSFFYWESLWGYISPDAPQRRRRAFTQMFAPKIN
ncbi:glycoside hydrolase family 10 protein [Cronbergia sp. UHCC 0137]|uniref:glycoside hydrolase family 10 protein n=1 Tax=Cronbergia sp. UHCC 0137 TaxID=3110239 RepID=UPI002B1F4CE3|nr:glycoside hydrolase family 10 protein [Cronbergia sp. UHCC 0137]MEA5620203.1 glycoside hydrolase family 10 protein [Cronbergia sp. UHCC 0137]